MSVDTDRTLVIVEVDDPRRCQSGGKNGQCRYGAMEHSKFCARHGGNKAQESFAKEAKRVYQLAKWQATVDGFADDDEVKSLRGEIGITRLLLQEILLKCKDSGDLLLYAGRIVDVVSKIEKLVTSCNRLEMNLGSVLDKSKILDLASQIVGILGKHVDEDLLALVSDEIISTIVTTQGKQ